MLKSDSQEFVPRCSRERENRSPRGKARGRRVSCGLRRSCVTNRLTEFLRERSLETESLGQEISDGEFLPSFLGTKENEGFGSKLVNHLPAGAARRAGSVLAICYGYRPDLHFRPRLCHSRKNRRAFRAVSHAIGGVFDVAADKDFVLGG